MSNNSNNKGILIITIFTLILTTLKLCNVIAWSWWWVISPIWIPLVDYILCLCVIYDIESKERFRRK